MRGKFYLSLLVALLLPAVIIGGCRGGPAEPGGIEGTVTDTDRNPVAGMRVFIVSGTTGFPEIAPITSEAGYYAIGGVPSGTFEVAVHDQEGSRVSLESVVVRSGQTSTLNFTIPIPAVTEDVIPPDVEGVAPPGDDSDRGGVISRWYICREGIPR